MGRFRSLFRRRERERELDRELRFHLEEQIRENLAAGMDAATARRTALLDFGGVDQIKEACRDATGASWVEAWSQDVKFGLRSLRKAPGFTLIALATLAIAIGFNGAIFSYLDGVLFRPAGYPDADRLVWIYETAPNRPQLISTANFLDVTAESTIFDYTAAHRWGWVTLTGAGLPAQVYCERVGIHFFDIFKVKPQLGRLFTAGDDRRGRDHVVIISHAFWRSQFSADPRIVGRPVRLDGETYTVIGVLPQGITDSTPAKMWRPLAFSAEEQGREQRWLLAWGKLKRGISLEQARVQLETISRRLAEAYPAANQGWKLQLQPALGDRVSGDVKQSLHLLMASVGMVMLIACANLANLTLARGAAREREAAVRAALGAGRGRLVRQFLAESLLLSLGGGLLGVGVAYASLAGLNRLVPGDYIPIANYVALDGRVLLFIAVLAVLTGLTFGLYPALQASRPDLRHALSQGGLGSSGGRLHQRFRRALVIVEVALAVVLLFGSGLLILGVETQREQLVTERDQSLQQAKEVMVATAKATEVKSQLGALGSREAITQRTDAAIQQVRTEALKAQVTDDITKQNQSRDQQLAALEAQRAAAVAKQAAFASAGGGP
jgi:putative ABC transport system permease protein